MSYKIRVHGTAEGGTTTTDETEIWGATLTTGVRETGLGYRVAFGCDSIVLYLQNQDMKVCASALTDKDFTFDGTTYSITKLLYHPSDELVMEVVPQLSDVGAARRLALKVDGTHLLKFDDAGIWNLSFPEGFGDRTPLTWDDPGFEWADDQVVSLRLVEPVLSGLVASRKQICCSLRGVFTWSPRETIRREGCHW